MQADTILATARACIGTPFGHQGRIPGLLLDCAGLVIHVAHQIGADYFDVPGYGRQPYRGLMVGTLDGQPCLDRVPVIADRLPGDVLLMRFQREPQHVAICAGATVVHSYADAGKVCEHDLTAEWVVRITAVYRFKAVA